MSLALKTVNGFLLRNAHAKTESNPKRKKVNIMKIIRTVLANVLLVGLERNIAMPQESITFNRKKILDREYRKIQRKNKQRIENNKNKIQEKKTKHYKDKEKYYEKNSKHRAENKDATRQQ